MNKPIFIITLLSLLIASSSLAQGIYKSVDKNGKVTYSSQPPNENAKAAELPEIMRGEVKVPESALRSCKDHGGIDCEAGEDSDNSVICSDGFKDSAQRFRFLCVASKLEVTQIGKTDSFGNFSVFVRNSKPIKADNVKVKLNGKNKKYLDLEGPSEIDGYGIAEYKFNLVSYTQSATKVDDILEKAKSRPRTQDFTLDCSNCQS